jgi:hypothetical protein
MNETKRYHLAIGDITDIEVQNADGETVGNFGDDNDTRALGVTIWNVQHEVWHMAIVTGTAYREPDPSKRDPHDPGEVIEIYVTGETELDIHGRYPRMGVKLEYTEYRDGKPIVTTEVLSYDTTVDVSVKSKLFGNG